MSTERLLTALTIGLLATSLGATMAAVHFYQLSLEETPLSSDVDNEIGRLGIDFFTPGNVTIDIDSTVALVGLNSTSQPR